MTFCKLVWSVFKREWGAGAADVAVHRHLELYDNVLYYLIFYHTIFY